MATLRNRNGNYSIRFVRIKDGKREPIQFTLKTNRVKIAEKLKRRLETDYELGNIDVFDNFNFVSWRDGTKDEASPKKKYLLSESIKSFLEDRPDLNAKSKANYKQLLNTFNNVVGLTMFTELVQKKDIQDFCFRHDISVSTQNNYLNHLKVFFGWVKENNHGKNVTKGISEKKVPENLKDQIITLKELNAILKAQKKHIMEQTKAGNIFSDSKKQLWFEPIIRFAYKTGLRKAEILNLRWKHIDIDNNQITVVAGKGGKSRTIVFDSELKLLMEDWKKSTKYGPARFVFESPDSTSKKSIKLGYKTASSNFKDYVTDLKLSDSIRFHSLRHTAATNYLKAGYNLYEVKKLMGHSSLSVTERYLHLVPNDLKEKAEELGLI